MAPHARCATLLLISRRKEFCSAPQTFLCIFLSRFLTVALAVALSEEGIAPSPLSDSVSQQFFPCRLRRLLLFCPTLLILATIEA